MKIRRYLMKKIKKGEKLHLSLIDPANQNPEKSAALAKFADNLGTDAILIGGSYALKNSEKLDNTIREIKKITNLPVILFPSSISYISKYADAIFFLSLLNSKDPRYIVREPAKGAPIIKKINLEIIPVAYLIVEPGMTAGKRGKAKLIKRDNIQSVLEYALFAEFVGFDFLYLEAGSGSPKPVPDNMIKAIKKETSFPLIVGGGIKSPEIARRKIISGTDTVSYTHLTLPTKA